MSSIESDSLLSLHGARERFVALRATLERFPLWILQLGLRVGVGMVFFNSGLLKINSWEFAIKLFEDEYKLPLIDPTLAAQMAVVVELGTPIFLFLGLATRLATLPLLGMIAVIQTLVYPQAWADHLLWASALVLLLVRGPGLLSVDALIDRAAANRGS